MPLSLWCLGVVVVAACAPGPSRGLRLKKPMLATMVVGLGGAKFGTGRSFSDELTGRVCQRGMGELSTEPGVSMPHAEAIMLQLSWGFTEDEKQDSEVWHGRKEAPKGHL